MTTDWRGRMANALKGYGASDPSTADILNTPIARGSMLPLTEYVNRVEFDPLGSGITGAFVRALTAPGRAYKGLIPDDKIDEEGANFAGFLAAPSAIMRGPKTSGALARHEAGYEPLPRPQRAFASDYGTRNVGPAGSRVQVDIEGRPLTAPIVAGRRIVGGADEQLSTEELRNLSNALASVARVPRSALPKKNSVGSYNPSRNAISIADDLDPKDFARTLAHETGHAIDYNGWGAAKSGGLPGDVLKDKARAVYSELATGDVGLPKRRWMGPEQYGYSKADIPRELAAEMFRAYMMDPNYLKTVHPAGAKAIRAFVNDDPILSKHIQFNVGGFPIFGRAEQE